MSSGNEDGQKEELIALEAIYGEDCQVLPDHRGCQVAINFVDTSRLLVTIQFTDAYPSISPPLAEFSGRILSPGQIQHLLDGLNDVFQQGESVVYNWIEWIKESAVKVSLPAPLEAQLPAAGDETQLFAKPGAKHDDAARQASLWEQAKQEEAVCNFWASKIIHGMAFTETKSTFQGHLAPVHSLQDVAEVRSVVMQNPKVQKATHNIMAYRITTTAGLNYQDSDDDGETAAGGRLLHLLQIVNAENVMVIVTRWYGGVLLGPARFTHINNAARMLLDQEGYIQNHSSAGKKKSSR